MDLESYKDPFLLAAGGINMYCHKSISITMARISLVPLVVFLVLLPVYYYTNISFHVLATNIRFNAGLLNNVSMI